MHKPPSIQHKLTYACPIRVPLLPHLPVGAMDLAIFFNRATVDLHHGHDIEQLFVNPNLGLSFKPQTLEWLRKARAGLARLSCEALPLRLLSAEMVIELAHKPRYRP